MRSHETGSPAALFRRPTPAGGALRLVFVCTLFAGCALVLMWRLYEFQVRDTEHFQRLADEERRAEIPIVPRRGALLDATGNPLAVSVLYDSVYVLGSLVGDPDRTASALSPVLNLPAADIRGKIDRESTRPVVLTSRVPSSVGEQVQKLNLPGVYLEKEPIRQYPEGSVAAQVLGFVGHDFNGLAGLELSYDDELAGEPGVIDTEKDTAGQEITLGRRLIKQPREGANLVLTLDRYVQRTAERILADAVKKNKATGGLILVMEPSTGNIIAAATSPTYNLASDEIYKPGQDQLYKTTFVTNQYEPGSTMKLVTMASAIDEGLVTPKTTMDDPGYANVAGAIIHNWDGAANGRITMTQLLIKSSNVGAQWVGGLLGPERFYRHIEQFGFGESTGVRLPGEVGGTVRTIGMPGWTRVDLATNSYGQGIAVTPLQMLNAVASFGNDGMMMRPRLVQEIRDADGVEHIDPEPIRQVVSPSTARTILQMMGVVGEQEAYKPHRIPGYHVALKTGTADTPTNLGYDTGRTFASVVSLLPTEQPRFAVLVRIDGPEALYGGVVAVPVLSQLAQELFTYYRVPPSDISAAGA